MWICKNVKHAHSTAAEDTGYFNLLRALCIGRLVHRQEEGYPCLLSLTPRLFLLFIYWHGVSAFKSYHISCVHNQRSRWMSVCYRRKILKNTSTSLKGMVMSHECTQSLPEGTMRPFTTKAHVEENASSLSILDVPFPCPQKSCAVLQWTLES